MQMTITRTGLGILLSLAAAHYACADTTNLIAVADTALRSSTPDCNYGAITALPVGLSLLGPPVNRCLFKFDLTAIPANAVVTSATLQLILTADPTPPADFELHRLLQDWGEGTNNVDPKFGGEPATAGEATWNSRFYPDVAWAQGGGGDGADFASTASGSATLGGVTNEFSSAGMVADVQLWVRQPGTNFGWILLATGEPAATGKLIASRENPDLAPVLAVSYSLSASPIPPTLFGATLIGNQFRFSFDAQAGRTYAVEYTDSLASGVWSVLTNVPATATDAAMDISDAASASERYYRVRTP